MPRAAALIALASVAAACAGDTTPPAVTIASGSVLPEGAGQERIRLALQNAGGAGFFKVEFWGADAVPAAPPALYATPDSVRVRPGSRDTAEWVVRTGAAAGSTRVRWVVVYSRAARAGQWVQTHGLPLR